MAVKRAVLTPDPITMKSTSPVSQMSSHVSSETRKSLAMTWRAVGDYMYSLALTSKWGKSVHSIHLYSGLWIAIVIDRLRLDRDKARLIGERSFRSNIVIAFGGHRAKGKKIYWVFHFVLDWSRCQEVHDLYSFSLPSPMSEQTIVMGLDNGKRCGETFSIEQDVVTLHSCVPWISHQLRTKALSSHCSCQRLGVHVQKTPAPKAASDREDSLEWIPASCG